jgi:hypothetical protein
MRRFASRFADTDDPLGLADEDPAKALWLLNRTVQ